MPKPLLRERTTVAPRLLKPRLYSVNDTAVILGVGVTTVYNLIARRQLAAVKIGDRSLITVETIDEFIASRPAAKVAMQRKPRKRKRP